ncbi:hypothetical protein ACI2S5_18910 [Ralstonia nicotianae]|uniref:Uncharacterized protein n=1 Tax=Ralstonia solanacearum TaxID=305 RepID=A0ABY6NLA4_RALSL|nr:MULTISPECIES: hypothetical protein [Ralstonia]QKL53797.1 hypothetical protein HI816_18005 [Ralstonia solanacearum]MDO3516575.1 hypothetical protein [Ralstonia pseudosolanacearum]QKM25051.1 hypothetical protein HI796_17995 [Ralstonia solanacearum]QKM29859.1 hypothetical protein HI795_18005 [Ralstonia solanacearum]UYR04430.1 hypothetical protein NQS37_17320 [Ralstonia pseudosolanacearum]
MILNELLVSDCAPAVTLEERGRSFDKSGFVSRRGSLADFLLGASCGEDIWMPPEIMAVADLWGLQELIGMTT